MSFIDERVQSTGLTFDDVLLVPAYSEVLPRTVSTETYFSRNIKLNIPIVSAAMDTVTEAPLAIALAREGGIGVIHKNMTIAEQAAHVRRVKRAENGMIYDPITITKEQTVGDALQLMHDNKIGGIPVIDAQNTLIGIVTNRDLRFQRDMSRRIEEVMTKENIITTHSTELEKASEILLRNKIEKLPVVDDHGKLIGLITYKDITKVQDHPNACKDSKGRLRVAAGIGVTADAVERVRALITESVDAVVIDSSHGHSKNVVNTLKRVKSEFPELDVVVGNIATAEAARYLVEAGADGIKVGIGPGSICTTRIIAGCGVPQLSAIYVSPLSLTVEMQESQDRVADIFEYVVDNWEGNISLTTVGGETVQITDTGPMFSNREGEQTGLEWGWDKDQGRFRFLPDRIIDPAEIASVTFFGTTIPLAP